MSDKPNHTPTISSRQAAILRLFEWQKKVSSGRLLEALQSSSDSNISGTMPIISIATLKRDLTSLSEQGFIIRSGGNKDSGYALTGYGLIHRPYDLGVYYIAPETERKALLQFNLEIFDILRTEPIFSSDELRALDAATTAFKQNGVHASDVIHRKELERFVIEFSWKSSRIEGNTYTLFETERLIREGLKKNDRSDFETSMILNHKKAYEFLLDQTQDRLRDGPRDGSLELSRRTLETIHALVVHELGVSIGLRKAAVGISGSLYRPLSLIYQIEEQLNGLLACIDARPSPYEKALLAILGESYLQPFEDGNKRTARVLANGLLLQAGYAPLSYRSVSEQDYKEACLIFYEQNSIEPFKKIFIDQYVFAANTYNIAT